MYIHCFFNLDVPIFLHTEFKKQEAMVMSLDPRCSLNEFVFGLIFPSNSGFSHSFLVNSITVSLFQQVGILMYNKVG